MTHEHQLQLALVGMLTSVIGLLGWVIKSYLRNILKIAQNTERHVNHVEEDICPEHGGSTLGQRVKQIQEQLEALEERNEETHRQLRDAVTRLCDSPKRKTTTKRRTKT